MKKIILLLIFLCSAPIGFAQCYVQTTKTNVSCNGGSNGSANAMPAPVNKAPYTYVWQPTGATTQSISGLPAGVYTVSVTNTDGCVATGTVTITQPAPLTASLVVNDATCTGCSDGVCSVTPSGGTAAYTYTWSTGTTGTLASGSASVTGLVAGNYYCHIKDYKGCKDSSAFVVSEPGLSFFEYDNNINVDVYPNPFAESITFKVSCSSNNDRMILKLYDITGREIFCYRNVIPGELLVYNREGIPPGVYVYELSDNSNILQLGKLIAAD